MVVRDDVTAWLNELLEPERMADRSLNGLQVYGRDTVTGIALGVDACLDLFTRAAEQNLNYVIVHHGFFWGSSFAITPMWGERMRMLLNRGMSLYACHLPMDAHPEAGHNAGIADALGLEDRIPFGMYKGNRIGFAGNLAKPTDIGDMEARLISLFGKDIQLLNFGPDRIHRVAVVSGDACDMEMLEEVRESGAQLFITGEPDHASYHIIRELELNVAFCGHYQTETTALKNLVPQLEAAFPVPVRFIDIPTGF